MEKTQEKPQSTENKSRIEGFLIFEYGIELGELCFEILMQRLLEVN